MFSPAKWAAAYLNPLDDTAAGEALEALNAVAAWAGKLPPSAFGTEAAEGIVSSVREAAAKTGLASGGELPPALERAARFAALLARRKKLERIGEAAKAAARLLDLRRGIIEARLESAFGADPAFEGSIREAAIKAYGAKGVALEKKINKALIGGYRLQVSGLLIDASASLQIRRLEAALAGKE